MADKSITTKRKKYMTERQVYALLDKIVFQIEEDFVRDQLQAAIDRCWRKRGKR
jgi:hypothetical protein